MRRRGRWLIAGLAVAALALVASAALAQARTGDVFVADRNAGAILKIPPSGGPATVLTSSVEAPYGMTLGRDGSLLVADQSLGVVRVNRTTGAVQPIFTDPGADGPTDVVVAPDGKLLVTAFDGGKIYRVNPKNGNFTTFFNGGAPVINASSLAASSTGAVFLSDETGGAVYRFARAGAAPTTVLDSLIDPDGLTLSAGEDRLFIGSFGAPTLWQVFFGGPPFLAPADQTLAFPPYSTSVLPSGKLLASDASNGEIHVIAPFPGSTDDPFSTGPPINEPRDIVVVPKKCGGRYPTIVGTNDGEQIRGSRYADVISAGGSRDLIKGLGGKDTICGGQAGDFVFGGGGRDRLFGEGGKDRLIGGKGSDVCRGGAGNDVQKSC